MYPLQQKIRQMYRLVDGHTNELKILPHLKHYLLPSEDPHEN